MEPTRDAILGATGFVGSTLRERLPVADLYDSRNLSDITGKTYRTVYCACIPAVKWKANKDPVADAAVIESIKTSIDSIGACDRFVVISTIDVHSPAHRCDSEDIDIVPTSEPYGLHRREFEIWVSTRFPSYNIVRLPALFGTGMKKNAVYDLLNNNRLEHIPINSAFQWYDMTWLHDDVDYVVTTGLQIANLYPAPVETSDVVRFVFPEHIDLLRVTTEQKRIEYNQGTRHARFCRSAETVLAGMRRFVALHRTCMSPIVQRLAVSTLGWMGCPDDHAAFVLRRYGIDGVEIVPSLLVDDVDRLSDEAVISAGRRLGLLGLKPVSMQSVLYRINGDMVSSRDNILVRMRNIDRIAELLGLQSVVFGSPGLRAGITAAQLSKVLDEIRRACPHLTLCLEPNARQYGCEVGYRMGETCSVAKDAGVLVNVDTGNAMMEGDAYDGFDPNLVGHAQVSSPFLADLDDASCKHARSMMHRLLLSPRITLEYKGDGTSLADNVRRFVELFSGN